MNIQSVHVPLAYALVEMSFSYEQRKRTLRLKQMVLHRCNLPHNSIHIYPQNRDRGIFSKAKKASTPHPTQVLPLRAVSASYFERPQDFDGTRLPQNPLPWDPKSCVLILSCFIRTLVGFEL